MTESQSTGMSTQNKIIGGVVFVALTAGILFFWGETAYDWFVKWNYEKPAKAERESKAEPKPVIISESEMNELLDGAVHTNSELPGACTWLDEQGLSTGPWKHVREHTYACTSGHQYAGRKIDGLIGRISYTVNGDRRGTPREAVLWIHVLAVDSEPEVRNALVKAVKKLVKRLDIQVDEKLKNIVEKPNDGFEESSGYRFSSVVTRHISDSRKYEHKITISRTGLEGGL